MMQLQKCQEYLPVTGAIKAFNPITGETKWSVPHNHFWNGGTLSTAGGITFQGNSSGRFSSL